MEWNQLVWYVPPAVGGLVIGHVIGMRYGRKSSKRNLQKLNEQSLELLDARSQLLEHRNEPEQQQRKQRLLTLTLTKLQQANSEIRDLKGQQEALGKKHFIEMSQMRLRAEEACETARKACQIAINSTLRLEKMSRSKKITVASDNSHNESGEAVAVSLADQARVYGSSDPISSLLKRDAADTGEHLSGSEANAG